MKKTGAIKVKIDRGGLIDALLCKKKPSTRRMPVGAQCEVELQMEMDRARDGRLRRRINNIVRRLPQAGLKIRGVRHVTEMGTSGLIRLPYLSIHE